MFRVVVCHILQASALVKAELALSCMAPQPMEAHPDHLDPALDDRIADEARSSRIVGLDRRSGLFPSHFFQGCPEGYHFTGCGVQRCEFRLCGQGHDEFDDLGNGEDWPIIPWDGLIFGQEDVGAGAAARPHLL
jgi:hypothetical protein